MGPLSQNFTGGKMTTTDETKAANTNKGVRKKALEAEAQEVNSVSFTFRGIALSVLAGDDMEIETMKFWEDGKVVSFVQSAVGDMQWRKLQRAGVTKVRDLKELANALFAAQGTTSGE